MEFEQKSLNPAKVTLPFDAIFKLSIRNVFDYLSQSIETYHLGMATSLDQKEIRPWVAP